MDPLDQKTLQGSLLVLFSPAEGKMIRWKFDEKFEGHMETLSLLVTRWDLYGTEEARRDLQLLPTVIYLMGT